MDTQDTDKIIEAEVATEVGAEKAPEEVVNHPAATFVERGGDKRQQGGFRRNTRKPMKRDVRAKQEFDNKLLEIRRVARVTSGGRRFSFSASVVAGDKKGLVGVGIGKASDTPISIDKALRDAKKNMFKVKLTPESSIAHEVSAKYGGSTVVIRPAPGRGVVAGGSVRAVLDLAGINSVSAKILSRSKNKINNARAAIKALAKLKTA